MAFSNCGTLDCSNPMTVSLSGLIWFMGWIPVLNALISSNHVTFHASAKSVGSFTNVTCHVIKTELYPKPIVPTPVYILLLVNSGSPFQSNLMPLYNLFTNCFDIQKKCQI